MMNFFNYFMDKSGEISTLLLQHIWLTLLAVVIAALVGIPLGILITKYKKASTFVLGFANVIQAVPSLAILGFLIPLMGIGSKPAIVMVFLYSLLPIIKNTYTGLVNINQDMLEAARAMGMTKSQILAKVQIPLALPIIMAGVRIAAVTAVGLMTIAAFIGAGGLGYLVYTGIQNTNDFMVIAGALPACILALLMDYLIGMIEQSVVPKGIKISSHGAKKESVKKIRFKNSIAVILAILVVSTSVISSNRYKNATADNTKTRSGSISIGSKNYTEQLILGNILSILIKQDTNLNVEENFNLGGTGVVFDALNTGDVDLYAEYTGTALISVMKRETITDPDEAYNVVKDYYDTEYGINWFAPLGFNNTYTLAIRQDTADEYNLETYSDLAGVSDKLTMGCTLEFTDRDDGLLGLEKAYNMDFKAVKPIDGGLRYTAMESKSSDIMDAFSTDGLLLKYKLKVLEDDKNFFPPYYPCPVIRNDTLKKYPELQGVLEKLDGLISNEEMMQMNYNVDELHMDHKEVATKFLESKGLLD
ncbi:MAG: glycine betaine ABC transporter substrate-binding protein [Clostridiaceae bacterium]